MFGKITDFRHFEEDLLSVGSYLTRVTDLVISKRYRIPLALLDKSGAFLFVETKDTKTTDFAMAYFAIKKTLYLTCGNVNMFIRSPVSDFIFTDISFCEEEITKDVVEAFLEQKHDKEELSACTIRNLSDHMKTFTDRGSRRILIKDGVTYELHAVCAPFGICIRDQYFPVADDDPKKFLGLAVFGGIFGLHKFAAGQYLSGLFYLLTCGGFGVFFLFDILSILTGSYYIRQISYVEDGDTYSRKKGRVYLRGLLRSDLKLGVCGLAFAALVSYLSYVKVFIPVLTGIGSAILQKV